MSAFVFFDLDGTILGGLSAENLFIWSLLKHFKIGPRQFFAAFLFLFRHFLTFKHYVFIKNKSYLAGLSVDEITKLGKAFSEKHLISKIRPFMRERILRHQKNGDRVIILTGAHRFLLQPIAESLGIDDIIATECATENGFFKNALPTQHPFHAEKLVLAKRFCETHGGNLKTAWAYGNSNNDRILLEAVGHPVAVTAHHGLRKEAKTKGWEMLD